MLLETAAGLLDEDTPEVAIRREAMEETGVEVGEVTHLFDLYMSPGSVTEKLHFYAAPYQRVVRGGDHHGVAAEGEDIEVVELDIELWRPSATGSTTPRRCSSTNGRSAPKACSARMTPRSRDHESWSVVWTVSDHPVGRHHSWQRTRHATDAAAEPPCRKRRETSSSRGTR